jgi:hypothetical protein
MKYFEDIKAGYAFEFDYAYEVTEDEIMEVGNRSDKSLKKARQNRSAPLDAVKAAPLLATDKRRIS